MYKKLNPSEVKRHYIYVLSGQREILMRRENEKMDDLGDYSYCGSGERPIPSHFIPYETPRGKTS
jgi:hypothetical protein